MGLTRSIPPTGWTFGTVSAAPANVRLANMEVFPGISMDPDVPFGKPCLTGTRIDVATIVGALAAGESADTVAAEVLAQH